MATYPRINFVNGVTDINEDNMNHMDEALENSLQKGGTADLELTTVVFDEYANISAAGVVTIDFSRSQKQTLLLTEDVAVSFLPPGGACNLILRVIQNGVGGWTPTLPTYYTPGGEAYVVSPAANAEDILSIFYDGSRYIVAPLYDVKVVV